MSTARNLLKIPVARVALAVLALVALVAVLGSHLYFQSERSWSPPGGHYVNLMNSQYDRVGIGVWVSSGRVRLVVDFYHP